MSGQIEFPFKKGCETKKHLLDERSPSLLHAVSDLGGKIIVAYDTPVGGCFVLSHLVNHWKIGLNQVVRFETKAYTRSEFPFNSPGHREREKFGYYLHHKAELCYGIFDAMAEFGNTVTSHYSDFVELWLRAVEEEWRWEINNPIFDKQKDISRRMEIVKRLKRWDNPYSPNSPNDHELKHNFNLIEAAISIAKPGKEGNKDIRQRREIFRDYYWVPYISALQDSTQELRKFGFAMVDQEQGFAYSNQKRTPGQPARKKLYPRNIPVQKLGGRGIKP